MREAEATIDDEKEAAGINSPTASELQSKSRAKSRLLYGSSARDSV